MRQTFHTVFSAESLPATSKAKPMFLNFKVMCGPHFSMLDAGSLVFLVYKRVRFEKPSRVNTASLIQRLEF